MPTRPADLILHNARVWNGAARRPGPAGVVIAGGRVQTLFREGVPLPAGPRVDLGGAVLTPGLVDAHLHLTLGAETMLHVNLAEVSCREAFEHHIERASRDLPPDAWLVATGWDETRWGGSRPDLQWLAAAGDRPAVCWRCDHHAVLVNEAVLRLVDLQAVPRGGHVELDGAGQPTGLLAEAAAWSLVNPLIPRLDAERRAQAVRRASEALLKAGITAVRSMEYRRDLGALPVGYPAPKVAVVALDRTMPIDLDWVEAVDDRCSVVGSKAFLDGTLGSRTARLRSDYADDPGNAGMWVEHAADGTASAWASQVVAAGIEPAMHAIGDAAVDLALSIASDVSPAVAVIEHAEVMPEAFLPRIDGVALSVQPTHRAVDALMADSRLGAAAGRILPLRDMLDAGGNVSFGTDWPIVPFDPVQTLRAAVTGEDHRGRPFHPGQAIDVHDAFWAATHAGSDRCGLGRSLVEGGPADCVVWHGDPFEDLASASVQATFLDGTLVAGALTGDPHD